MPSLSNSTVKIKRRKIGNSGAPSSLKEGELAFNEVDQTLYYGSGDDGSGNATNIITIAGEGYLTDAIKKEVTDTGVRSITGVWQNSYTTVASNSSDWNSAYSIATKFSEVSSTFLTSETDSQTLSFNENDKTLSISNGNVVSLSSLVDSPVDTGVRSLTSDWTSTHTTVQNNSGNWTTGYNNSLTYQTNSASYATNTLVGSISSQLTPLTVTSSLTSQLVTNNSFNNYQTNVSVATATLLPTAVYQSASGNWTTAYTIVQNQSANWGSKNLSFNENNQQLSISLGNTVSLSSLAGSKGDFLYLSGGSLSGSLSATNITVTGKYYGDGSSLTGIVAGDTEATTLVRSSSGNWNSSYTTVQSQSSQWASNIDTSVRNLTSNWNSAYSTVQSNSASNWNYQGTDIKALTGNWTTGYNNSLTYQSNSATYATNSLVSSVSAQLTPLTVTSSLTSQLVTNNSFNSYKTSVSNSTAALLPTSIYQNASGNWQNTYNTVSSLSSNWQTTFQASTAYVASNTVGVNGATAFTNIMQITQDGYNQLVAPSSSTLYIIID